MLTRIVDQNVSGGCELYLQISRASSGAYRVHNAAPCYLDVVRPMQCFSSRVFVVMAILQENVISYSGIQLFLLQVCRQTFSSAQFK